MSATVDIEAIPILYLTLSATQSFLAAHVELVWPLLALLIGLWFLGAYGRLYGAVTDLFYYKRETLGKGL